MARLVSLGMIHSVRLMSLILILQRSLIMVRCALLMSVLHALIRRLISCGMSVL